MYNSETKIATVKDVKDPKKLGRIRVEIPGRTEGIEVDALPWYWPARNKDTHDLPGLEEKVYVNLVDDNIYYGYWRTMGQSEMFDISDEDYESAKVLISRDLSENNDEGELEISYKKSVGLLIKLREQTITFKPDGAILIDTGNASRAIEINKDCISIGSEGSSMEHAVMGDTLKEALTDLVSNLQSLGTVAAGSPYTQHLKADIDKAAQDLSEGIMPMLSDNVMLD